MKYKFRHTKLILGLLAASLSFQPAWPQNSVLPSLGDGEGISLAAERKLGDRIARELYRDPDYLEDPVLDEYIQRLWAPLIKSAAARGELMASERQQVSAGTAMTARGCTSKGEYGATSQQMAYVKHI